MEKPDFVKIDTSELKDQNNDSILCKPNTPNAKTSSLSLIDDFFVSSNLIGVNSLISFEQPKSINTIGFSNTDSLKKQKPSLTNTILSSSYNNNNNKQQQTNYEDGALFSNVISNGSFIDVM
ncbi:hypothetical protein ACTFIT_011853 [Dictyostelium discoideum]